MANRDTGLKFLRNLLKHVPEDVRGTIAPQLEGNAQLVDALAADAEAVAGVETERQRLTDWFNRNQTALTRAKMFLDAEAAGRLKILDENGEDPDDPLGLGGRRRADAPAGLDEKTVQSRIAAAVAEVEQKHQAQLNQVQTEGLTIINKVTKLSMQHLKDFNEVLDTDALTDYALKNNLRIDLAYDQFVKPRRDEITKQANEAALKAAREEGLAAGRMEALNRQIPVPAGSASGTLTGLGKTGTDVIDASLPALVQELRAAETAGAR